MGPEILLLLLAVAGVAGLATTSGGGDDEVGSEELNLIEGTPESDDLPGTDGADLILALEDDDLVRAEGGNDVIQTGTGNDVVLAGAGDDTIISPEVEDDEEEDETLIEGKLIIEPGFDSEAKLLIGGDGEDTITGGVGGDLIVGGGPNTISDEDLEEFEDADLEDLADELFFSLLFGGEFGESEEGPSELDSLLSELLADDGDADVLVGADGSDLIVMGAGDTATGGDGSDLFVIANFDGLVEAPATITDFNAFPFFGDLTFEVAEISEELEAFDSLVIPGLFDDRDLFEMLDVEQSGDDALVTLDGDTIITLQGAGETVTSPMQLFGLIAT